MKFRLKFANILRKIEKYKFILLKVIDLNSLIFILISSKNKLLINLGKIKSKVDLPYLYSIRLIFLLNNYHFLGYDHFYHFHYF